MTNIFFSSLLIKYSITHVDIYGPVHMYPDILIRFFCSVFLKKIYFKM